eukprot:2433683-Rhodomonas_salina.1
MALFLCHNVIASEAIEDPDEDEQDEVGEEAAAEEEEEESGPQVCTARRNQHARQCSGGTGIVGVCFGFLAVNTPMADSASVFVS